MGTLLDPALPIDLHAEYHEQVGIGNDRSSNTMQEMTCQTHLRGGVLGAGPKPSPVHHIRFRQATLSGIAGMYGGCMWWDSTKSLEHSKRVRGSDIPASRWVGG